MIYLGSDHGGFLLKEKIKGFLKKEGYTFMDLGDNALNEEDDYPVYAFSVAEKVGKEDDSDKSWNNRAKGILFCRSAGGVIIAANKVKGVYAIAVTDVKSAKHSRLHNDANVIGLSGDWMTEEDAKEIVKVWLTTEYSREERHSRRIDMIKKYEKKN